MSGPPKNGHRPIPVETIPETGEVKPCPTPTGVGMAGATVDGERMVVLTFTHPAGVNIFFLNRAGAQAIIDGLRPFIGPTLDVVKSKGISL